MPRRGGERRLVRLSDLRLDFNRPQSTAFQLIQPGHTTTLAFGRGVGKSWFDRTKCYLKVAEWDGRVRPPVLVPGEGLIGPKRPGIRIVILMPTLEQFRKVHLPDLLLDLDPGGTWGFLRGKVNKTTLRVDFPGGSWIQVVSAEAAQGARGIRCDMILADECDDIDKEILDAVALAWLTEPYSFRIVVLSGTPKRGRYGLLYRGHHEWPKRAPERRHAVHATCYDAPRQVSRAFIDTEVRPFIAASIFEREYLCNYDASEGLVYGMFTPDFHVRRPPAGVVWSEVLFGLDHGYEDPAVILVVGIQGGGRDARAWVLEELYVRHRTITFLKAEARKLRTKYARFAQYWFADPSRPDLIEEYRRADIPVRPANNAIEDGVASVADRFAIQLHEPDREGEEPKKSARLFVTPDCANTIRELGVYRRKRDPRNPELVLEDILDKDNHAMDALRYAVFTRFGTPVSAPRALGEYSA